MLYCDSVVLEQWVAPPQEDFPRPTWTKLSSQGRLLSNSIEYAEWDAEPIEPMVCEQCWNPGCALTGLARMVTLPEQLLWVRPHPETIPESWRDILGAQSFLQEAIVMPRSVWDSLHSQFPMLPAADHYPQATRRDLAWLWLTEMPVAVRLSRLEDLERRLHGALASDPLDLEPARENIRRLATWLGESPAAPVSGRIVRAEDHGTPVNSFYFDGPPFPEWPAFVVGRTNCLAFGGGWVFLEGAAFVSGLSG